LNQGGGQQELPALREQLGSPRVYVRFLLIFLVFRVEFLSFEVSMFGSPFSYSATFDLPGPRQERERSHAYESKRNPFDLFLRFLN